jgi:hypothetical protein
VLVCFNHFSIWDVVVKNASICWGVCGALVSFVAFAQSNDSASAPKTMTVYNVKDLAVWSQNGTKFDPTILIELIKLKVSSDDQKNAPQIRIHFAIAAAESAIEWRRVFP